MLLTVVQVGNARCALEAVHIVEVTPLLRIHPAPHAVRGLIGVCNYRGAAAPVIDLNQLAGHPPAPRTLSTRLLFIRHDETLFALLAGGVTETIQIEAAAFVPAPREQQSLPWLGPMAPHGVSFVQKLEIGPLVRELRADA